jgi:hypothetical protein
MRVEIFPPTPGKSVVLCDKETTDVTFWENFMINGRRLTQIEDFPRAEEVELYNRRNRRTEITFEAHHSFVNYRQADEFVLGRDAEVPEEGQVRFTATDGGRTFRLDQALVTDVSLSRWIGTLVIFRYSIVGGKMKQ